VSLERKEEEFSHTLYSGMKPNLMSRNRANNLTAIGFAIIQKSKAYLESKEWLSRN
jgi:hypothetical protein